jgi:hypothetical protein
MVGTCVTHFGSICVIKSKMAAAGNGPNRKMAITFDKIKIEG